MVCAFLFHFQWTQKCEKNASTQKWSLINWAVLLGARIKGVSWKIHNLKTRRNSMYDRRDCLPLHTHCLSGWEITNLQLPNEGYFEEKKDGHTQLTRSRPDKLTAQFVERRRKKHPNVMIGADNEMSWMNGGGDGRREEGDDWHDSRTGTAHCLPNSNPPPTACRSSSTNSNRYWNIV